MREMQGFRDSTEAEMKTRLSWAVLNIRSGNLLRSLRFTGPARTAGSGFARVTGEVGTGLAYGRIHEFGGTTKAHVILPRNAKVLAFRVGGQQVFARRVNHPGSRIPARMGFRATWERNVTQSRNAMRAQLAALKSKRA